MAGDGGGRRNQADDGNGIIRPKIGLFFFVRHLARGLLYSPRSYPNIAIQTFGLVADKEERTVADPSRRPVDADGCCWELTEAEKYHNPLHNRSLLSEFWHGPCWVPANQLPTSSPGHTGRSMTLMHGPSSTQIRRRWKLTGSRQKWGSDIIRSEIGPFWSEITPAPCCVARNHLPSSSSGQTESWPTPTRPKTVARGVPRGAAQGLTEAGK